MSENIEHLLDCQICMEDFEESGEHTPRLLPCTHTLCEKCLQQIIRDKSIQCPECRAVHTADNNERSFPLNKYLLGLIHMKRKPKLADVCDKHGRELTLFCRQTGCLNPICPTCLSKDHQKHDVIGIEEVKKKTLFTKMNNLIRGLQWKKMKFSDARTELKKNNDLCITNIKAEQENHVKKINEMYEKLVKQALDETKKVDNNITKEIAAINENLDLLFSIEQNTDQGRITPEDVGNYLEVVTEVSQSLEQNFSGTQTYRYPEYRESQVREQVISYFL